LAAQTLLRNLFQLTSEQSIGGQWLRLARCLAGSVVAGWRATRFGRKKLLLLSAVLFCSVLSVTALAGSFGASSLAITGGLAIGIASNVSPTYIVKSVRRPGEAAVALNKLTSWWDLAAPDRELADCRKFR